MQTILLLGNDDSDLIAYKTLRSILCSLTNTKNTHDFSLICAAKYDEVLHRLKKQFKQMPKILLFTTAQEVTRIVSKQQTKTITLLKMNDIVSDNFFSSMPDDLKISIPEYTLLVDQNILKTNKVPSDWLETLSPDTLLTGITYDSNIFKEVFGSKDIATDVTALNKYICLALLYTNPEIEPNYRSNVLYCRRDSKTNNKAWLALTSRLLPEATTGENSSTNTLTSTKVSAARQTIVSGPTHKQKLKAAMSRHLNAQTTTFIKDSMSSFYSFKALRKSRKTVSGSEYQWDKELIATWSNLNDIEPLIRPSKEKLNSCIQINENKDDRFCSVFAGCVAELQSFEHIVLVPHLNKGGADLAALHLVNTIGDQYKTAILATGYTTSEWFSRVNQEVKCLEAISLFQDITEDQRLILLTMLLQFVSPKFLSIINSYQGYQLLKEYQEQMPPKIKIFLHTYAFDMTEDGFIYNFIEDGIPRTYPRVDHYITDSKTYKDQLVLVQGIPADRVDCVYLPIDVVVNENKTSNTIRRVLWASRVSSAKLVEVAVGTAKILSRHNIEVDFYGVIEPDYQKQNRFLNMLKNIPLVQYKGGFDGFGTLPHERYDVFLLTTKNEGMPNVVIDAISANHYVVAPPVGGIPEVIEEGINGGLVKDKFSPDSYAKEILSYYSKDIDQRNIANRQALNKKVVGNHTRKNYKTNLLNLYKY